MLKVLKRLFAALACVLLLAVPVSAAGLEDAEDAFSESSEEVEAALPDSAREALGGETGSFSAGVERLLGYIRDRARSEINAVLAPLARILVVVVLSTVASGVIGSRGNIDYVNLAAVLAVAVLTLGDVSSLIRMGGETLDEMTAFSRVLLPALTTAAAAAGAYTSASAKYLAASLFLDVLMGLARNVILPLVGAYAACVVASAALGDSRLSAAVSFMKWLCNFLLTSLVTVFTAYLSISGIVASATDAAVLKAAKSAISTFIPVVGNIVSSASGALVGGAGVIRASLGVLGLLGVAGVCALPFLRLGVRYVLFRATAAAAQAASSARLASLVSGLARAYGMILALVGSEAVFLYVSIISMIKAVGSA